MKINMFLSGCFLGLLCFIVCDFEGNEMNDYIYYVNFFIGIGGYGYIYLGVMVFYGMIQLGLDICIDGWDFCFGYYYEDIMINGFVYICFSGIGCVDFGDFLLMLIVGVQCIDFLGIESQKCFFVLVFFYEKEYVELGYYFVFLDIYGVKVELILIECVVMYWYIFLESKEFGFILDMDYNIQ